jgi:hypothetical protein
MLKKGGAGMMDFKDEYINKSEAMLAVTQDGCTANVVGVLYHLPPADVVAKSEVDREIKVWQELYADTVDKWEKAYEELEIKLENAKADVAREIFEEIEKALSDNFHADCQMGDCIEDYYDCDLADDIAELKKKHIKN